MGIQISIETFLSSHNDPCVIISRSADILAANQAFLSQFDLTEDKIVGQPCEFVYFGNQTNPTASIHQQVLKTGVSRSYICCLESDHVARTICRSHCFRLNSDNDDFVIAEVIMPLEGQSKGLAQSNMAGSSTQLLHLIDELAHSARNRLPVLLEGESGTGKELAAEFIHNASAQRDNPFLTVDCTVLGADLFESELFGHEKGAFTGSTATKKGLFELADNGTIFLDEIGEIPLAIQPKLLRALESGSFRRVGGTETLKVSVRLVCATNRDLRAMVDDGLFREDLYYRIAVFTIQLPALRKRLSDLPELCTTLLSRQVQTGETVPSLTPEALIKLSGHSFPGNIRELANVMNLAQTLTSDLKIEAEFIRYPTVPEVTIGLGGIPREPQQEVSMPNKDELEALQIGDILERFSGNRREVAEYLGISERTLYRKIRRYNL